MVECRTEVVVGKWGEGGVLSWELVHFGLKQPRERLWKEHKSVYLRHYNTSLCEFSSQRLRSDFLLRGWGLACLNKSLLCPCRTRKTSNASITLHFPKLSPERGRRRICWLGTTSQSGWRNRYTARKEWICPFFRNRVDLLCMTNILSEITE